MWQNNHRSPISGFQLGLVVLFSVGITMTYFGFVLLLLKAELIGQNTLFQLEMAFLISAPLIGVSLSRLVKRIKKVC
jgi:uncharacterized membrane protein (UPF0136 family)